MKLLLYWQPVFFSLPLYAENGYLAIVITHCLQFYIFLYRNLYMKKICQE